MTLINTKPWMERSKALVLLALFVCLVGCGDTSGLRDVENDRAAHSVGSIEETLVARGGAFMSAVTTEKLRADFYPPQWLTGSETVHRDTERFPLWAQDQYTVCVYWQQAYVKQAINSDRRPGRSSVYVQIAGKAWGWILVGEDDAHILELSH